MIDNGRETYEKGIITKGIGGFYYVNTGCSIVECKARGKFRNKNIVPLVGDRVEISGNSIENILPRSVELVRPSVANITQLILVASVCCPQPNMRFITQLLVIAESKNINCTICLNKMDLASADLVDSFKKIFNAYTIIPFSSKTLEGFGQLQQVLGNHVSAFTGASGVGKSSILNTINPMFNLETGGLSAKIQKGRHTTRHVELLALDGGGFVLDTPGFTSVSLDEISVGQLQNYFKEFRYYSSLCQFRDCNHMAGNRCAVIQAVEADEISPVRYEHYVQLYNELRNK